MGGSASRMEKSIDAEIIMEFTDAEIIDALTANIAPPDAPPRHTQPPPQPPLQTGFITRPPPTAAIPEASCALRAVEVVSAWFGVPAGGLVAPPHYPSAMGRRIPTPPQPLFNTYCDLLQRPSALSSGSNNMSNNMINNMSGSNNMYNNMSGSNNISNNMSGSNNMSNNMSGSETSLSRASEESNRKRARPNREDATLGVTDEITREARRRMYGNQMISTSRDGSYCEDKSFHTTCSNTSLAFPPEQLQDVAQ